MHLPPHIPTALPFVVQLVELPCGCMVDLPTWVQCAAQLCDNIECMWCGGTFHVVEFAEWYNGLSPTYRLGSFPRRLIRHADRVLEVVTRCQCGGLKVRVRPGEDIEHLMVNDNEVQLLRD